MQFLGDLFPLVQEVAGPPEHLVPSCSEGGVLGVLAGIVGSYQASEAIKLILGIGTPLIGRLLLIDALDARVREVRIARDPQCSLCGDSPSITEAGSVPEREAPPRTVPTAVPAPAARKPAKRAQTVEAPAPATRKVARSKG